jgi:hypothetical protein
MEVVAVVQVLSRFSWLFPKSHWMSHSMSQHVWVWWVLAIVSFVAYSIYGYKTLLWVVASRQEAAAQRSRGSRGHSQALGSAEGASSSSDHQEELPSLESMSLLSSSGNSDSTRMASLSMPLPQVVLPNQDDEIVDSSVAADVATEISALLTSDHRQSSPNPSYNGSPPQSSDNTSNDWDTVYLDEEDMPNSSTRRRKTTRQPRGCQFLHNIVDWQGCP